MRWWWSTDSSSVSWSPPSNPAEWWAPGCLFVGGIHVVVCGILLTPPPPVAVLSHNATCHMMPREWSSSSSIIHCTAVVCPSPVPPALSHERDSKQKVPAEVELLTNHLRIMRNVRPSSVPYPVRILWKFDDVGCLRGWLLLTYSLTYLSPVQLLAKPEKAVITVKQRVISPSKAFFFLELRVS